MSRLDKLNNHKPLCNINPKDMNCLKCWFYVETIGQDPCDMAWHTGIVSVRSVQIKVLE